MDLLQIIMILWHYQTVTISFFAYDEQPYAMDTVVIGGDPNATVEGLIVQELDQNQNLLFQWRSWDHFHVLDNIYIDTLGNQFPVYTLQCH